MSDSNSPINRKPSWQLRFLTLATVLVLLALACQNPLGGQENRETEVEKAVQLTLLEDKLATVAVQQTELAKSGSTLPTAGEPATGEAATPTQLSPTSTPEPTAPPTPTSSPTPEATPFAGFVDLRVIIQKETEGDYFLFDADGNQIANLSEGAPGKKVYYALSPDAQKLLFIVSTSKADPFQFWIADLNGGKPKILFEMAGQNPWVMWSPDNQRFLVILNSVNTTQEWQYYLKDLSDSEPLFVHKVYYTRYDAEWSPDGKYLGLLCDTSEICLVDPLTGEITNTKFKGGGDITFSPDGKRVIWDDFQYWYSLGIIYTMKIFAWQIGEDNFTQLTSGKWLDSPTYPIWSSDSQSIYYTDVVGGEPQLMQATLDGAAPRMIQNFEERIRLLSLSPDGKWLSIRNIRIVTEGGSRYLRYDHLGVIRTEDGQLTWTKVDAGETHSSFWSPDGKFYIIQDLGKFTFLDLETGEFTVSDWLNWLGEYDNWIIVQPDY